MYKLLNINSQKKEKVRGYGIICKKNTDYFKMKIHEACKFFGEVRNQI